MQDLTTHLISRRSCNLQHPSSRLNPSKHERGTHCNHANYQTHPTKPTPSNDKALPTPLTHRHPDHHSPIPLAALHNRTNPCKHLPQPLLLLPLTTSLREVSQPQTPIAPSHHKLKNPNTRTAPRRLIEFAPVDDLIGFRWKDRCSCSIANPPIQPPHAPQIQLTTAHTLVTNQAQVAWIPIFLTPAYPFHRQARCVFTVTVQLRRYTTAKPRAV